MEVYRYMYGDVNMLALILGVVVHMGIGVAWYSKFVFGKPWLKGVGKSEKVLKRNIQMTYVVAIGAAVFMAYILGYLLKMAVASTMTHAFTLAFIVWLGFTAAPAASEYAFAGRSKELFFINAGYNLISLIIMAAIFMLFG